MGLALGKILARASLSVREWGSEPEGPVSPAFWLEAIAVGGAVLTIYGLAIYAVLAEVLGSLRSIITSG